MINTKIIGNKIAEARKKINLSQAQLAKQLFISSQAVGKWERGESMPDITTLSRLAEILGVDLNHFSENFQTKSTEPALESHPDLMPSGKKDAANNPGKKLSWDMSQGNWVDADFSGLKNLHEKFSSSNMQRCKFIGSDLSGLLLKNNNVNTCDFSGSDLSGSHIQRSILSNNVFKNCLLKETEFTRSNIDGCDFNSATFTGAEFSESFIMNCDFTGADFTAATFKSGGIQKSPITNAVWNRTSFNSIWICDIVFDGTVEDCSFENCAFKKVTFQNATLINNFFKIKNRRLKGIAFVDCKADRMTYEFLKAAKADLTGITLLSK